MADASGGEYLDDEGGMVVVKILWEQGHRELMIRLVQS